MRIYIVDDDPLQSSWIYQNLQQVFSRAKIVRISTEHEFRSRFEEIANSPADKLIIMDVMLRWTDPAPNLPTPPEDVLRESFYRAGLRCCRLLANHKETENIPVILYTVLEEADLGDDLSALPSTVSYLPKESDAQPLIDKIRMLLNQ